MDLTRPSVYSALSASPPEEPTDAAQLRIILLPSKQSLPDKHRPIPELTLRVSILARLRHAATTRRRRRS